MHCVGLQTCRKPREYSTMVKKSPLEENSLETMNEVSIELRVKINWSENRTDLHKVIGRTRDDDFRHHETRSEPSSDSDWFNFNFEKETCNELARDHRTRSTLWFLMTFFLWCGWVIKLDDSASSCMWSHALNTLQYHTQDNWELFSVRVLMGAQNVLSWIVHAKSHWTCQIFLPFFRVWFKDLFFTWKPQKLVFSSPPEIPRLIFKSLRCENFALEASRVASATSGISEMLNKKNVCRIRLIDEKTFSRKSRRSK